MITYIKGDLFNHIRDNQNNIIIAHVCNNLGGWNKGFTGALSKEWKYPEIYYRQKKQYILGSTDIVQPFDNKSVVKNRWVANMIAQDGYSTKTKPACDLLALQTCLLSVASHSLYFDCEIHMPKVGAGLGGRDWTKDILPLINLCLINTNKRKVFVYDL